MIIQKTINAGCVGELIKALGGLDPDTPVSGGLEEGVTLSFLSSEDERDQSILQVDIEDLDDDGDDD
jgi:hypothetical protein